MIPDYHVHSDLSIDARGSICDYARKATTLGLEEICFTPHLDLDPERSPKDGWVRINGGYIPNSDLDWVSAYFEEIEKAEDETSLIIRKGLEVDYFPSVEKWLLPFFQFPWDFVLGSVHCLEHLDLVNRQEGLRLLERHSLEKIAELFISATAEAIRSGLFNAIAHLDSFRRSKLSGFNHDFRENFLQHSQEVLVLLKERAVALEINTSGFGKYRMEETFPGLELLKKAKSCGIELITFGSDSHSVSDLACGFPQAISLAHRAGFEGTCTYKGGKVESVISF